MADSYLRYRENADGKSIEFFKRWLEPEIEQKKKEVARKRREVENLNQGSPIGGLRENAFENAMNDSHLNHVNKLKYEIIALEQEVEIGRATLAAAKDRAETEREKLEKKFGPDGGLLVAEISEQEILMRIRNDAELNRVRSERRARLLYLEQIQGGTRLDKVRAAREKLQAADRAVERETELARQRATEALEAIALRQQQARGAFGGSKKSRLLNEAKNQIDVTLSSAETTQENLEKRLSILESKYQQERQIVAAVYRR